MRRVNRFGDGLHVRRGFLGSERFVPDQLRQVLPVHIFHREVMLAGGTTDFEDRNDIRMFEAGGRLGFDAEALDERITGQFAKEEQLDRDDAVQVFLPRLIDNSHSAACDLFDQLVVAQSAWDERGLAEG